MLLHEFLTSHREELIRHCREKVSKRYAPVQIPQVVDHGVPLFLEQLVRTLEAEQATTARAQSEPGPSPVPRRSAAPRRSTAWNSFASDTRLIR